MFLNTYLFAVERAGLTRKDAVETGATLLLHRSICTSLDLI